MKITCVMIVKFSDDYIVVDARFPHGARSQLPGGLANAMKAVKFYLEFSSDETSVSETGHSREVARELAWEIADEASDKIVERLAR